MNNKEAELLVRLLETFQIEAREHVEAIFANLIELERAPDPGRLDAALEKIYRAAHSLKGGARIVNLTLIEILCQSIEACLAAIKRGERAVTPSLLDLLHESTGIIEKILSSPTPNSPDTTLKTTVIKLRQRLDDMMKSGAAKDLPAETPAVTPSPVPAPLASHPLPTTDERRSSMIADTVRIPAVRLDELLLQVEELIALKVNLRQQLQEMKDLIGNLSLFRQKFAGVVSLDKNAIREHDRTLANITSRLVHLKQSGEDDFRLASGMIETLISNAKDLLMFPFSSITDGFPKLVREMTREQGKEVELKLKGDTIELDRRILQELKDPLVHIIRNCIDHGIETVSERRAAGKPDQGLIEISVACVDNGKVEIKICDDGRGIDIEQITEAAKRLKIITSEAADALSPTERLALIFRSGLSSRKQATAISGRGLGLAIVSERASKLGGNSVVQSTLGAGTSLRLIIPLSLATFRGIRIRVGKQYFAIPTLNVQKVCRKASHELKTIGNQETLVQGERTMPVVSLSGILGIYSDAADASGFKTLMILDSGQEQVAFEIDEVIGEDDLLVKGLGPQLVRVRNISGATVLGNGTVVPILNALDLLKSALGNHAPRHLRSPEGGPAEPEHTARRILVVDDSITSRTLLKNVLESYGYDITTAVDGVDGLTALQAERFDLVSLDVDMPRMDGFELTARIRADERFARLPIVLVTSMDSAEDRKKGINAGADAYIVKSSFDQNNLLDIIRKLI